MFLLKSLKGMFLVFVVVGLLAGCGKDTVKKSVSKTNKKIEDTRPPVVKLNGKKIVSVKQGATYKDPGATATDTKGQKIKVSVFDNVNTEKAGTYGATYVAVDQAGNRAVATRIVKVKPVNLLAKYNIKIAKNLSGLKYYPHNTYIPGDTYPKGDHTGCVKMSDEFYKWLKTKSVFLKKDTAYIFSAYIKIKRKNRNKPQDAMQAFKGQNVNFYVLGNKEYKNVWWNVSKENQWEEVLLQYIPKASGNFSMGFLLFDNSFIRPELETINQLTPKADKANIDKSVEVYVDNFSIVETDEILSSTPEPTEKVAFEGPTVRIDRLGNWEVKEHNKKGKLSSKWKPIFPKLIWPGNFKEANPIAGHYPAKKYADYGFNGYMTFTRADYAKYAIEDSHGRIKYFCKQVNYNRGGMKDPVKAQKRRDIFKERFKGIIDYLGHYYKTTENPYPGVMFLGGSWDNENASHRSSKFKKYMEKFLLKVDDANHDGKRDHPMYMLNGNQGVARAHDNKNLDIMDVTGTYINAGGVGEVDHSVPVETLGLFNAIDKLKAPGSSIQLQTYLHEKFIPALFFGIIQGGRSVGVWRDGTTHAGTKKDFTKNVWAPALAGYSDENGKPSPRITDPATGKKYPKGGVFAQIDKMLIPIIRQPRHTEWSATVSDPYVKIGTRDFKKQNRHFLILANFADKDKKVKVSLGGIDITKAKDFFTGARIKNIDNGVITIPISHSNFGYSVIEFW